MHFTKIFASPLIFQSISQWALGVPKIGEIKINKQQEKEWGNDIIKQQDNIQWSTVVGEYFVFECLRKLGEKPRRPKKIGGYCPDWETNNNIYEVKTKSWTTMGTSGEKAFGSSLKYVDIPKLYNKPLIIVCVAYQEYALKYGNTPILGDNIQPNQKKILDFYKNEFNIEYISCSDLIKQVLNKN
jgi:hypothetical protein